MKWGGEAKRLSWQSHITLAFTLNGCEKSVLMRGITIKGQNLGGGKKRDFLETQTK